MEIYGDLKFTTPGAGELQNTVIERLPADPAGEPGRIYYNTTVGVYRYYSNVWNDFGTSGDVSNVIISGGYMLGGGTFNPSAFIGFSNIDLGGSPPSASPQYTLLDILKQLDTAITTGSGTLRLESLVDVDTITSGSPLDTGGNVLVHNGTDGYDEQRIQYIYDSTLVTPGSPSGSPVSSPPITAAKTHIVNHNIGQKYVDVIVYDDTGEQIVPQNIVLNSVNQLTIKVNPALNIVAVVTGVPSVIARDGM